MDDRRPKSRPTLFGEVESTERLTPSMIRVVLSGGQLDRFEASDATDAYINARFVPAGSPLSVPFGSNDLEDLDPEDRPRPRRFTIRRWVAERQELTIDFVAHGDAGYAGTWAQRAVPGDRLQFSGPSGSYRPNDQVDWHLLVGDESALPAIAASLEAMPTGAVAKVLVVVDGPNHELPLTSLADVSITWVHRSLAEDPESALPTAVAGVEFPHGSFDVFVHGEAGEVRAIRKHLVAERAVDVSAASISPYWRRTFDEEAWRKVKRDWLAAQAHDTPS